ncbi:MAG: CHAT domain-containing protein [Proteobacteria bacterium]|nr:CHAT domain-containing protein [Pseudomonadota bacterium]
METRIAVASGHTYLIEVAERDNDALVEVLDSKGQVVARADHPERRTGTRRVLVTTGDSSLISVRVTGKEHAGVLGTASVAVFDTAVLGNRPGCLALFRSLAEGDAAFAAGEEAASGHAGTAAGARAAFQRAERAYVSAEQGADNSADEMLRGQTALAIAGLEYLRLQDWQRAAEWAVTASRILKPEDPYRAARADALLAAAWIETGSTAEAAPATSDARGGGEHTLVQAHRLLDQLVAFHLQRGERYDAGLQLTNIGLSYLNEGDFHQCIDASAQATQQFGAIHEPLRRAIAEQNRALCLWGLGRLPEAVTSLHRALADITPDTIPGLYVSATTNTALAEYALGHLDESLRLYDSAMAYAERVHAPRDVAYCLYGIGVNYYALGDRQTAREFLERSLAIRAVAVDGRGRMASLRALATIDAEQGEVQQALAHDREALQLAIAPGIIARIKIQQAAHTAAAGQAVQANEIINAVLASPATNDPLIKAEALLQRAVLLRAQGRPREALADLEAARPGLRTYGSVMEEFEGDLELARTFRDLGRAVESLVAVEKALEQADAVRLQTANPELRAQLQTPLRPAYDLKLELLRDRYEAAMHAGRAAQAKAIAMLAYTAADSARAHSFSDIASQRYSPAVRTEFESEFHRREDLYRDLSSRRAALESQLERSGADDPSVKQLVAEVGELRRQVDTVNTAIARQTMKNDGTPRGAHTSPALPTLGAKKALVSYWVGSQAAYVWVIVNEEVHWTRLGSPDAIAAKALAFHRSLSRLVDVPVDRRLEDAAALYTLVVRPIEPIVGGVHDWVIIPDGALSYVPFAALRTGNGPNSFVAFDHDVAVTPAGWMLDGGMGKQVSQRAGKILIVADPVYQRGDPRMPASTDSVAGHEMAPRTAFNTERRAFRRLPFTAKEAADIASQFPPDRVHELLGLSATRDQLLALDWSQFEFIHIATHGVADAQVPALSSLILGNYDADGAVSDREVRVADVALKRLTADVVVLSACETALGTEVRSEGLVGMSSTMLARGAHAVVASLWPVPDEIGAQLMTDFYGHMLRDAMSPQAALNAVMRSMAARARSSDPALWAAFQLSIATVDGVAH